MSRSTTLSQLQYLFQLSIPNNKDIDNFTGYSQDIIEHISAHKILMSSYSNLKQATPLHLTSKALQVAVMRSLGDQLKIKVIRDELLKSLKNKGIEFSELKGFNLSSLLYPNEYYRQIRDIDILVKAEDLQTVHDLLISMGAILMKPHSIKMYFSYERRYKDIAYRFPNANVLLELHTRLVSVKTLANQTLSATLLKGKTSIHEDFVYLCIHGVSSGFHRLKWLTDIYLMTHRKDFCWQKALQFSRKVNATKHLYTSYLLLNHLLSSKFDDLEVNRRSFDFIVARFVARICLYSLSNNNNTNRNTVYLYGKACELLCVESFADLRMFTEYLLSPRLKSKKP